MSKQAKWMIGILLLLAVSIGVLLFLNRSNVVDGQLAEQEKTFRVTVAGKEVAKFTVEALEGMESDTFPVVIRSSGEKPKEAEYTGVELSSILEASGVDLQGKEQLTFTAMDGYVVAANVKELEEGKNFYLAYAMDGEPLKTKSEDGNGPYQLIIRKDPFSQRWCKYLQEVDIQ